MRPCDLVKLHTSEIKGDRIIYCATKKKNYTDEKNSLVNTALTPTAKEIMENTKDNPAKVTFFPLP